MIGDYLLIPPDWKNRVVYRRRWMTNIASSLNNTEQRSMLFTWPRRSLSFSILTKDPDESAYLKRRLYKNLHNVWGIPFWQDRSPLTATAPAGQKILNLDTRNRNFDLNGRCVIYESPYSWEIGIIDVLSDYQITLSANLSATWSKGTDVYPILAGRIKNEQFYEMVTSSMVELSFEAVEEFDSNVTRRVGDASNFPMFKGYPVFDKLPDWSGKVEFRFIRPYEYLSFLGKSTSFSHYDETEFSLKTRHLTKSRTETQEYLDFFDGCVGRWSNFWQPSYQQDIRILDPFSADATQLIINDVQFATYWFDTKAGKHIWIEWPDGGYVCAEIAGFVSPNILVLETPIGRSADAGELLRIRTSFLYFGRLDQDEIQVEYEAEEISKIQLSFQSCLRDTPEVVS